MMLLSTSRPSIETECSTKGILPCVRYYLTLGQGTVDAR